MRVVGPESPNWVKVCIIKNREALKEMQAAVAAGKGKGATGVSGGTAAPTTMVRSRSGMHLSVKDVLPKQDDASRDTTSSTAPSQEKAEALAGGELLQTSDPAFLNNLDADEETRNKAETGFTRKQARKFVQMMAEAKRVRLGDIILEKYIDNLVSDSKLRRVLQLPEVLERKLYYDIVRTTLQIFEIVMLGLDGADVVGHQVAVKFRLQEYGEDENTTKLLQPWTSVNQSRVEKVIRHHVERTESLKKIPVGLPGSELETDFIVNISRIVMHLMTDLFCDSRIHIRLLGHELKWVAEPMPREELDKFLAERPATPNKESFNPKAVKLFVEELLSCDDTNIVWVPDSVEAKVYEHVLTTVMCIMEEVLSSSEISIMGLRFRFSLISAVSSLKAAEMTKYVAGVGDVTGGSGSFVTNGSASGKKRNGRSNYSTGRTTPPASLLGGTAGSTDGDAAHFASEDVTPIVFGSEPSMRQRLADLYREASVYEKLLQEPGDSLVMPYKATPEDLQATAGGPEQSGSSGGGLSASASSAASSLVQQPSAFVRRISGANSLAPDHSSTAAQDHVSTTSSATSSTDTATRVLRRTPSVSSLADQTRREFQKLAAQDQLARFLQVRRMLPNFPIEVPFRMIKDVERYKDWMPMCTGGEILERDHGLVKKVQVAFGIDTKTFLGVLGDNVTYEISVEEPQQVKGGVWEARVVADTGAKGFAYGERLVYDWVFIMRPSKQKGSSSGSDGAGESSLDGGSYDTEVSLNLFLKVNSVLYLPIWDSLQKVLTQQMLQAFEKHASTISGGGGESGGGSGAKADTKGGDGASSKEK
ncbi:unnamed protein product [Amoebophrya sp. A25]|nr:unnamed protein product [Amoebophrya sp. A25]|eukprot:GSA25T00017162001.1